MEMSGSLASELQYDLRGALKHSVAEFAGWDASVGWTVDGAYCHHFNIYFSVRVDIYLGVVFFEVFVGDEAVFQSKDLAEAGKRFVAELDKAENENYNEEQ